MQTGLTFLVLAYPGCSGKEAVKWVFVSQFGGLFGGLMHTQEGGAVVQRVYSVGLCDQ